MTALAQVIARLGFEPGTASVLVSPGPLSVAPVAGRKTPKRDVYVRLTLGNAMNPKPVETPVTKGVRDGGPLAGGGATLFVQRPTETLLVELMASVPGSDDVLARAWVSLRRLVAGNAKRVGLALMSASAPDEVFATLPLMLTVTGFSAPRPFEEETEEHYRRRLLKMRQRYPGAGPTDAVDTTLDDHADWEAMMKALVVRHGPEPGTFLLSFTVCACRDLPRAGTFDKGDPYVVLQLAKQTVRTKTIKGNLAPSYNETFTLDVWDPANDVVTVTVMDEDVDDDDVMCATKVAVFGVAQGVARELWVPLVKDPDSASAKAVGHIRVRLQTTSFGASVPAGDTAAQEAASARIVAVLQKFAPAELTSVDSIVSRCPADADRAVRLAVGRYGFEPGSIKCSITLGSLSTEPGIKPLSASSTYLKLAPAGHEHDAKVSKRFRDPTGTAVPKTLLVGETSTFDLQSPHDCFTLRVKAKSGATSVTVAAVVLPIGCLTAGRTYSVPAFAPDTGRVAVRIDVTMTYSDLSAIPTHARLSAVDPQRLSAILAVIGPCMTPSWRTLMPAAAPSFSTSSEADAPAAANALVLLRERSRSTEVSLLATPFDGSPHCSRDGAAFLFVRVLACRDLPKMDTFGACDAYVEGAPSDNCKCIVNGATLHVANTLNPDFSADQRNTLLFAMQAAGHQSRRDHPVPAFGPLKLTVWDYDSVGANDLVGCAELDWRDHSLRLANSCDPSSNVESIWLPIGGRDGQGDPLGVIRGWIALQFGFLNDAFPEPPPPPATLPPRPGAAGSSLAPGMSAQVAISRLTRFLSHYKLGGVQSVHPDILGPTLRERQSRGAAAGEPLDVSRGFSELIGKLVKEWGAEPTS